MTIVEVIKNPRTIVTAIFLLLAVAVITFGARIGLTGSRQWIAIAALALLLGLIQLLIALLSRKGKKADVEQSMVIEADAAIAASSAEEKQQRELARKELLDAIAQLKKTTVSGGLSGGAALSALPWYLVMGPESGGKSAAIADSGLQLPGASTEALSGISSSQNCDWWFTNQALILEANHRFTTDDPAVERDWTTFLELLRKTSSDVGINGVIVTVPADIVLRQDTDHLRGLMAGIRKRLDRIPKVLHVHCPVYLMVTKADLVPGFSEFFADLDTAPRNQVFGCTIPVAEIHPNDPTVVFRREFDLLYGEIYQRRAARLVQEREPIRRQLIYGFPLEFQKLRDKLEQIVAELYRPNPLGATPAFRGFYLSCGADAAASRKPHFLKGFFLRALIPDYRLARSTSAARSRQRIQSLVLQGVTYAGLAAVGLMLIVSFSRNQNLLTSTREMAEAASNVVAPSGEIADITEALDQLERLRLRLDFLHDNEDLRPPTLAMGMYRGNVIGAAARDVYIDRLVTVLLAPSREKFAEHLKRQRPQSPDEIQDYMAGYRAYRMLVDPDHGEPDHLTTELIALWSDDGRIRAATEQARTLISDHVHYAWQYVDEVDARSAKLPHLDQDLVRQASRIIRESWKPERYYETVIADINKQTEAYNLERISRATGVLLAPVAQGLPTDHVPGAFTKAGWISTVRDRVANSESRLREDWILRDVFKDQEVTIMGWLMRKYVEDYIAAWSRFLGAIDVDRAGQLPDTGRRIWDLAGNDSALMSLLSDAHENLRFDDDEIGSKDESILLLKNVESSFAALHTLFEKQEDIRPIDTYLEGLGPIAGHLDELQDADNYAVAAAEFTLGVFKAGSKDESAVHKSLIVVRRHTKSFQSDAQEAASEALHTLLSRPAQASWRSCLAATGGQLNASWNESVTAVFNRKLRGRYPFGADGSDASIEDVADFFGPEGTFWTFVAGQVRPYLRANWHAKQMYGYGLSVPAATRNALSKAELFKQTLFDGEGGTASVEFSLAAQQVRAPEGTSYVVTQSVIEIGRERLRYDMGRTRSLDFVWPNPDGAVPGRVAVNIEGRAPDPISIDESSWTIFRLLDRATVEKEGDRDYRVVFTLRRQNEYELPVTYRLRAATSVNPFGRGFFTFQCPSRIAN